MKPQTQLQQKYYYHTNAQFKEVRPPGSSRIMLQCMACHPGIDGVMRRCSRMYRKSERPSVSSHRYEIPVESKVQVTRTQTDDEQLELFNTIARTAACLNFTLNQITSPAFNSLLTSAVSYGISLRSNYHDISEAKLPDLTFSRTKIRQHIIDMGNEERDSTLVRLKQVKFVSAAIDNGTIVHRKLMFVALQNPAAGLEPTYYKVFTTDAWNGEEFANFGQELFLELKEKEIILTVIVGDNLRSQVAGLAHWMPGAFQNTTNDEILPEQKAVLYVPCCCHILNLGFMDTIRNDDFFRDVTEKMLDLAVILRKNDLVKFLGARIPEIPATRWVYLYNVSKWLTKYSAKYSQITHTKTFKEKIIPKLNEKGLSNCIQDIPKSLLDLNRLLLPVKIAMNKFEDPKTSLSEVLTILNEMIENLNLLAQDPEFQIYTQNINFMIVTIKERFRKNGRFDLIVSTNAFTSSGRRMFRMLGVQSDMPMTVDLSDDDEDNIRQGKSQTQSSFDPDPESDSEDSMEQNDETYEAIQEDNNSIAMAYVQDEEHFVIENPGFICPDETDQLYSILMDTIEELCKRLNMDENKITKCWQEMDFWLFQPSKKLPRISELKGNEVHYWKMENLRTKSILSTIVLRLLSLGASEACCERFISQNRTTLDANSSRQKDDLLQARNEIRANYLVQTLKKNK